MFALLLIPILVSGYILVVANLYHFFQLHRHDGQLLYLKVAAHGTFSVLFVVVLAALIKILFPSFHPINDFSVVLHIKKLVDQNKLATWLALISICSILISITWVIIVALKNLMFGFFYETKNHENIRHAARLRVLRKTISDGTLDAMLLDAMESDPKIPIMVTLSSRKVYVGIVNGIQEPTENEGPNKYVSIFPIMSGYRDKDNLQVDFCNTYKSEVVVKSAATVNQTRLRKIKYMDIVISLDEISHISWFDFAIYQEVNNSMMNAEPLAIRNLTLKSNNKA